MLGIVHNTSRMCDDFGGFVFHHPWLEGQIFYSNFNKNGPIKMQTPVRRNRSTMSGAQCSWARLC